MAYANSVDPDQTSGAVWSGAIQFAIPQHILRKKCIKNLSPKKWNKMYKILGHLLYVEDIHNGQNYRFIIIGHINEFWSCFLIIYGLIDTIITLNIGTTALQAWANSVDPDQMLQNAAPDQGLHCFPFHQALF